MQFEDRVSIDTPEGVNVELTLAGVGSRFMAAIIDTTLQFVIIIALGVIAGATSSGGEVSGARVALFFAAGFLIFFGYDVLFETLHSGRTPGKQIVGVRVVRTGGGPVGFLTSAVRNLLRLIDILPSAYLIGIISILATARNQRLGDLAAGTLVVRDSKARAQRFVATRAVSTPLPADAATWDLSAVTAQDLATVRQFLDRRAGLLPAARARLAYDLAIRLRPMVLGPSDELHPEVFLEHLSAAKAARG